MPPAIIAKLAAPRATRIVRRTRVLSAIDRGLRTGACWIAAPAGYGKTLAVTEYLQRTKARYVWYRVDEDDQDVASFFHYMTLSMQGARMSRTLPAFGPEYGDQPLQFARRFFRAYLAKLRPGSVLVLDDLHKADVLHFRAILAVLLRELPESVRCVCVSRTLPPSELTEFTVNGRLAVVDESVLRFADREARALVRLRLGRHRVPIDITAAGGWAAGLVLLAERASASAVGRAGVPAVGSLSNAPTGFAVLAGQLIDSLPRAERELLMKVSLLPEVSPALVGALGGATATRDVLEGLRRRQLLVVRSESSNTVFHLHDLLREYLRSRLLEELSARETAVLMEHIAQLLNNAGYADAAIELALQSRLWPLAQRLIMEHAETLLGQGRRATLMERCAALPPDRMDAWLCYWMGVATASDDATAESWFARAWTMFSERADARGCCLTAAHAVLSKADSWRTHEGLAVWTNRAIELLDRDVPGLGADEELLAWTGMLRASDFAATSPSDEAAVERLTARLLARLDRPRAGDSATRRLLASEALIEHAGLAGRQDVFECAVDSVAADVRAGKASPWALGLWLVGFGAMSARYFAYTRRGFPYASAEDALRAAIAIGERESLRGVEFGGLYHLQLLMKSRNDPSEFAAMVGRLAAIADSRYTTQVAVVADCQAALHTMHRDFVAAHLACDRFMAAIEAANEPPLERWPHFVTKFQVLLGEGRAAEAGEFLAGLLPLFTGALRQRTETCVLVARACAAKANRPGEYPERLRECLREMHLANWPTILLNLPDLLAELCADGIELDIESEFCRSLVTRRALLPPATRPLRWPWALRVHVLGAFSLDRDGVPLDLGPKPSTRSLDIVRALAVAKDHTCAVQQLYDWLWPDLDGDQAKAACEQALHRLRRLLGRVDLVVQREGRVRFASDKVWVDLDYWEGRLSHALHRDAPTAEVERAVNEVPGPLLRDEPTSRWLMPAAERVRSTFIDLAKRLGARLEERGEISSACGVYLRALEAYPTSERCYEALVRARLSAGDPAGALEDYLRCERVLASTLQRKPGPSLRALVAPLFLSVGTVSHS
jgi:LuxR family transcriptional regulator, maltose regulon positive regulatory protein